MNFKEYVSKFEKEDSPRGDFCSDYGRDTKAPDSFDSEEELKFYLWSQNACDEAEKIGRRVFRAWRKKNRR